MKQKKMADSEITPENNAPKAHDNNAVQAHNNAPIKVQAHKKKKKVF
jgi:hypothetical protein